MLKKAKVKSAAKRVKKTHNAANKTNKRTGFWKRVWNIICWPFRKIWETCCKIWKWLKTIDLVAMLNLTLLVAIIVLFSMLIIDVIGCTRQPVVVVTQQTPEIEQIVVTEEAAPTKIVLPLTQNNTPINKQIIDVVPVKKSEVEIAKKQIAKQDNTLYGDIIVDNRASGAILQNNMSVKGNLFLQNMRKYVLPCDIRIEGNLFLRDVNMLQFCGDFVITGNIYVSPRSSFGPIPKTARVGGHVVF